MDVVETLTAFGRFRAEHRRTCGVDGCDVSADFDSAGAATIVLSCPTCGSAIEGEMSATDWPAVLRLLKADPPH
jgi:hypothetical protein